MHACSPPAAPTAAQPRYPATTLPSRPSMGRGPSKKKKKKKSSAAGGGTALPPPPTTEGQAAKTPDAAADCTPSDSLVRRRCRHRSSKVSSPQPPTAPHTCTPDLVRARDVCSLVRSASEPNTAHRNASEKRGLNTSWNARRCS